MADKFKISSLNAALDEYLAKIDKVNLSRGMLESNRDLLLQTARQLEQIDAKMDAVRRSGLSDGERSGMLSLLSNVRSGMLSGKDLSGYLRQESRQMDLARQGSAMSQLSRFTGMDRIAMQEVSRGLQSSGLAGSLPSSTQMLGLLLSWSGSRSGVPSAGMMSHLQSRAFSLGSSLTSGDSLLEDVEEDARDDKFDEAVESIKQTSDEIVDALQGNSGDVRGTARSRQESAIKGSTSSRRLSGDWVDSLTTIGAVVGTVAALGGLFLVPKVQDFFAMLSDPERRRVWWDGLLNRLTPVLDGLREGVSEAIDKAKEIYDTVVSMTRTVSGSISGVVDAGSYLYSQASSGDQQRFQDFAGALRSQGVIDVIGVTGDMPVGSAQAVAAAAYTANIAITPRMLMAFRSIYKAGRFTLGASGGVIAAGPIAVALAAVGSIVASEARKAVFNSLSIQAAIEEGSSVAVVYEANSGERLSIVPLVLLMGDSGGTLFSELTVEDQLGAATKVAMDMDSYRRDANNRSIIGVALQSGKLSNELTVEGRALLEGGSSEDINDFRLKHHRELMEASAGMLSPAIMSDIGMVGATAYGSGLPYNNGVVVFHDGDEARKMMRVSGSIPYTPFDSRSAIVAGIWRGGSVSSLDASRNAQGNVISQEYSSGRSSAEQVLSSRRTSAGDSLLDSRSTSDDYVSRAMSRFEDIVRSVVREEIPHIGSGGVVSQQKTNVIMGSNTQGDEQ